MIVSDIRLQQDCFLASSVLFHIIHLWLHHCEHDNFPCLRSAPLGFEVGVFGLFEKGEEAEEAERRR